ncbi:hypothetical protein PHYPSEUDO_012084 [Phytophthora pseudosyringae]|uniref:Uncharacterized protein n=1 Tax=Phytophthora pseudosyringae TaxID=221518 RepID=A0A8T1VAN8_9STRA|nr:hypothetical protein PHYPSEUDO_012084 [Phytophthora pseudosyringae]
MSTSSVESVEMTGISTHFTASPSTDDDKLREYSGYFYSDDDLLNRIWYAGAYTLQLCGISACEARASPPAITAGWVNNATIEDVSAEAEVFVHGAVTHGVAATAQGAVGSTVIVQRLLKPTTTGRGAKRDSTPWPGDYGVATHSKAASLNGATSCLSATRWNRSSVSRLRRGGKNTAANSLLYHALKVKLADDLGFGELSYNCRSFSDITEDLKSAVNEKLWDSSAGFFCDSTTALGAAFYPQAVSY